MSFYDEAQMQVTKTDQNVPLLHGHGHEAVNATGRSCRRRQRPTRQSNAASDRQRHPINVVLYRTPHLEVNSVRPGLL